MINVFKDDFSPGGRYFSVAAGFSEAEGTVLHEDASFSFSFSFCSRA